jgi:tetratricopeptide (TPR) repeat protein
VHDVIFTDDGRACLVMQYVEGRTLAEALRRGPLDARQALDVAAALAAALSAAHARGIIHRDIKPQNVMLTPSGQVKLLDFGIARVVEPPTAGDAATETSLTSAGVVAGTPAYMSPEQIRHQPVDARSDLFSLGAVIYEALTGRRAFTGPTVAELYGQILHEDPPAPSAVRPGLTPQHDELCRRLLAKHAADRFASAEELSGALRVLLGGTGAPQTATARRLEGDSRRTRTRLLAGAAIVLAVLTAGVWRWTRVEPLPAPPAVAEGWFNRGVQKIRDGSYHGGVVALTTATSQFDRYALAFARLAEAHDELDEGQKAQRALLQVTNIVPDLSRVPLDDRLRLDAIRWLVTRDLPAAVAAYQRLASRHPGDAGAWVDLGRAHEAAGALGEARASYEQALATDPTTAAAHLRMGLILKDEGRRDEALEAFARAEELYARDSNVEGQAETLLRRGAYLNALDDLPEARATLERVQALVPTFDSPSHQVRVQLQMATLTASEGRFADATALASAAVQRAQDAGLPTVAAEGLNDLALTLMHARRFDEADEVISRAVEIARAHDAERTLARAALQRASIRLEQRRAADALADVEATRAFVTEKGYRRYELTGLLIAARAHEGLGQWDQAAATAREALALAEDMKDEGQAATALDTLAVHAATVGNLPAALAFRERIEQMHRKQGAVAVLPYDLASRAELLARLGRHEESEAVLAELDAGIAEGREAYARSARRAHLVRAMNATFQERWADAARHAGAVVDVNATDGTARLASALIEYGSTRLGRRRGSGQPLPDASGETLYWLLMARLVAGEHRVVLDAVEQRLSAGAPLSPEYEWRLAAIGAAAAEHSKTKDRQCPI